MAKINEVYCVIAADAELDGEGLCAFSTDGGKTVLPMVSTNREAAEKMIEMAKQVAEETGKNVTLVKFSAREEVRTIGARGARLNEN